MPTFHSIVIKFAFTACLLVSLLSANAQTNVLTQHNDNRRTGQNLDETILNHENVAVNSFGKLFSYPVDGHIYAQPLVMSNVAVPGKGTHNIVFVATARGSVYAFDADDNTGENAEPLWKTTFVNPLANIFPVPYAELRSDDITPEISIIGTPVIDPDTASLFVVAKTKEIVDGAVTYMLRLHALSVETGEEKPGSPIVIQGAVPGIGTGSDPFGNVIFYPQWQNQRAGLLLLNNVLYMAFGSHGDEGIYHGWILGYDTATLTQVRALCLTPNGEGGGIWHGGAGLAADRRGNIYTSTGDGSFDAQNSGLNYGDSIVRISTADGGLTVTDFFTPYNQSELDVLDQDLGSGAILLLPKAVGSSDYRRLLITGGKGGQGYLLDRENMGGFNPINDSQIVQSFPLKGLYSGLAYYKNRVYTGAAGDYLRAFSIDNSVLDLASTNTLNEFAWPGTTPSISANGNVWNSAIVWAIEKSNLAAVLHAYKAEDLSVELYNSAMAGSRDATGRYVKFSAPTIANGKVYVGTQSELAVYGNGQWATQPTITPEGGEFTEPVLVTITNNAPGAEVRYTTDGSTPTETSPLYTEPFLVDQSVMVQARAFLPGYRPSGVATAWFLIDGGPGNGDGLRGFYFPSVNFGGTPVVQVDPTVDMVLPEGTQPTPGIGPTYFSVRWTGWLLPRSSGPYTLYTNSDDVVRLWVDNQLVIDHWTNHRDYEDKVTLNLTQGQPVSIRMEYYQRVRYAVARLSWSGPGIPQQIIPQSQLFSGAFVASVVINPTTVTGGAGATGTVILGGTALTDTVVTLSSNSAAAGAPATVTIPQGASSADFAITTIPVTVATNAWFTATFNGVSQKARLVVSPVTIAGVSLLPNPVTGGRQTVATVTLKAPAAPGDLTVSITSANPGVASPEVSSIVIPAGQTTGTFNVNTTPVTANTLVTITSTVNGKSWNSGLTVRPPKLISVTISPNSVIGGIGTTGTVTLDADATADTMIALSSNNGAASVPASVTIPQGVSSATFPITTSGVTATASAVISAVHNAITLQATLNIQSVTISTVALRPNPIAGGLQSVATVTLKAPAAPGDLTVSISSDNPGVASPEVSSIVIPAGQTTGTFNVNTSPVNASTVVTITATLNGKAWNAKLTVRPPKLTSVTISPNSVIGGIGTTGTVLLDGPAPTDTVVPLGNNNAAASVQETITIPQGASSVNFPVLTTPVTTTTSGAISASFGGVTKQATLTVSPVTIAGVTLRPNPIAGGLQSVATVTLKAPAAPGDLTVSISSDNPGVASPEVSSIVIPAGQTTGTFNVNTSPVNASTLVTITATLNGKAWNAKLTVRPVGVLSLVLNPNPATGGTTVIGTVTLETPAALGDVTITLLSNYPAFANPVVGQITIPAGQTTGTFEIATTTVTATKTVNITASAPGRSLATLLTLLP